MLKARRAAVDALLCQHRLDALVVLGRPNLRYLCDFTGSDGALVVTADAEEFLTDSRYTTQARQEVLAGQIREYRQKAEGIGTLLREQNARRIGFEAEVVSVATAQRLREEGPAEAEWVPLTREIAPLRGQKVPAEIAALEAAAQISAEAFAEICPLIRPGTTEKEVALALEFAMKRRGAEEKSFDIIVASGVRGALPHGVASDKVIAAGELVTIDYGACLHGYCADETVTVAVGAVSAELRHIYATVLEAHDRALALIRPGVPLREIDAAAREFIAEQGFGDRFGHGLGHGVGLEVHEFPTVSPRSEGVAVEGMVFTVEPGIYVPEVGGVRIEDMVLVTADGCRPLTRLAKEFQAVH